MKRTLQLVLLAGAGAALAVVAVMAYAGMTRPNLLRNPAFEDGLDGWKVLALQEGGEVKAARDGADRFAVVDTRGVDVEDRNPYLTNALGQLVHLEGEGIRRVTLRGRVFLESEGGTALVMLKAHGADGRSGADVFRFDGPAGEWVEFELSAGDRPLDAAEVALGVYGRGRARFDDLDMVEGGPRGYELPRAALAAAFVLLALGLALAGLELAFPSKKG